MMIHTLFSKLHGHNLAQVKLWMATLLVALLWTSAPATARICCLKEVHEGESCRYSYNNDESGIIAYNACRAQFVEVDPITKESFEALPGVSTMMIEPRDGEGNIIESVPMMEIVNRMTGGGTSSKNNPYGGQFSFDTINDMIDSMELLKNPPATHPPDECARFGNEAWKMRCSCLKKGGMLMRMCEGCAETCQMCSGGSGGFEGCQEIADCSKNPNHVNCQACRDNPPESDGSGGAAACNFIHSLNLLTEIETETSEP